MQALTETIPPSALTALPRPQADGYWGLRLGQTAWLNGKGKDGAQAQPARTATYLVRAFDHRETV